MYSPYRRWNGCLGGIGAFTIKAILGFSWATENPAGPLLIVVLCLPVAIIGLIRLAFRHRACVCQPSQWS